MSFVHIFINCIFNTVYFVDHFLKMYITVPQEKSYVLQTIAFSRNSFFFSIICNYVSVFIKPLYVYWKKEIKKHWKKVLFLTQYENDVFLTRALIKHVNLTHDFPLLNFQQQNGSTLFYVKHFSCGSVVWQQKIQSLFSRIVFAKIFGISRISENNQRLLSTLKHVVINSNKVLKIKSRIERQS